MCPKKLKSAELSSRKEMLFEWLLSSGILDRRYWALHHNYDTFHRRYGPLYTEVTGYGISLFLNNLDWSRDPSCLKYAQNLANFVHSSKVMLGDNKSCLRFGSDSSTGLWDRRGYSFDAAVCISAIIDLNQRVNTPQLLQDALETGRWLVQDMQNRDGSFKACIDTPSRRVIKIQGWFGNRGCLHGKIAMSLLKLYQQSRKQVFLDGSNALLEWLLSLQYRSGGILARQGESYVFTHSHCYASEALVYAYWKLKEEKYLTGLMRSTDWLVRHQAIDGGYYQSYGLPVSAPWRRVDATAQACRLLLLMYLIEPKKSYLVAAERAAGFVVSSQVAKSTDVASKGGLCSKHLFFLKWPELSSWTNLFAIHALHLLERVEEYDFARAAKELF